MDGQITIRTIRDRAIIDSVVEAFDFGFGSKEKYGPIHVNIWQSGGELSVRAQNIDTSMTLIWSGAEDDEKDKGKITLEETFRRLDTDIRFKTIVYPDGKIERTRNDQPIPMTYICVDAERKRVKEITARVIPLVRPFIGPSEPMGRPNLEGRGSKPAP